MAQLSRGQVLEKKSCLDNFQFEACQRKFGIAASGKVFPAAWMGSEGLGSPARGCVYRKLDPDVLVMKSAEDRA
jgi:hypothetical protein